MERNVKVKGNCININSHHYMSQVLSLERSVQNVRDGWSKQHVKTWSFITCSACARARGFYDKFKQIYFIWQTHIHGSASYMEEYLATFWFVGKSHRDRRTLLSHPRLLSSTTVQ